MHIGPGEIALIVVLALVLFGAKRLPQVGRAAGEAIREFKSAFSGVTKLKDEETNAAGDGGGKDGGEGNGNAG